MTRKASSTYAAVVFPSRRASPMPRVKVAAIACANRRGGGAGVSRVDFLGSATRRL
jgi:hypothetical protein